MTAFEQLRDDTLAVHAALTGELATRLAPTRARLLAESRARLNGGQFTVVVCGEFKRGKSSLLNALVEWPGLFPVDPDIATSAVLTLAWGAREGATVYFAETIPGNPESAPPPQPIDVSQAADFVTEQGNPGNAKNVLSIKMRAPVERLATGIILADTPGTGSDNPAHTAATAAFLKFADALLFVVSAVEPPSTLELDFLRRALKQCPIVVTAVTMIDRVVDPGPVAAEARARIASAAGCDPASLVIVPVSSFRKRDALDDGDDELLAESGFPRLEAELWQGLAVTIGVARVNVALTAMYAALTEAAAPVANDLAALRGDPGKAAAELREQHDMARKLKDDAHGWKRSLNEDLELAIRPVQRQLDADLDKLSEDFRHALGTSEAIEDPNRVIQSATTALMAAGDRANDALEAAFDEVAEKYAALTELPIVVSAVTTGGAALPVSVVAPPRVTHKARFTTARQIWSGGLFLGGLGATIGSLIVPGAGTVVGGVVGLIAGLFGAGHDHRKAAEERQRREYVNELRGAVLPKLDAGRRQLVRDIADQAKDYSRALTRGLDDEITARGDSLAASIKALEETARQDAQGRASRERGLSREQARLGELRTELDRLRTLANGLARHQAVSAEGAM